MSCANRSQSIGRNHNTAWKIFRQFTKREHKIAITPLPKGEDITNTDWTRKETAVQEDFIWAVGPEAISPNNPNRIQNGSGQYKNKRFNSVIHQTLLTETQYIPQPKGLLLGQTIRK